MVTDYRPPTAKPCRECPFRKKAAAGWLGAATPESFIHEIVVAENALPCHLTLDYTDPDWKKKWEAGETGQTCAGALIMAANMCKRPRDPNHPRMKADPELVFPNQRAFLDYHNNAPVKSWEIGERRKKKR